MATAPTPKIVTATPADIRAYFAFRAFQIGDRYTVLGEDPFSRARSPDSFHPVDRAEFLRFDLALEAWKTGDRKLVSKGYQFICDCRYGNGKHDDVRSFNPPGEAQTCYECGERTGYDSIPAIRWYVKDLLADPEAREAEVDVDFIFRDGAGEQLSHDFAFEYIYFIGANIRVLDVGNKVGGKPIYPVRLKTVDAPNILGTEGLIAEMRFHGKHGLFLPEAVASE